jgi:ABC-type transport system involved in cytochrome c biogenesis ATPase subunit
MILKGVEFVDFACLDRQFVPLRPGINLLVGRNNAGKTALLRGLSALSALPASNSQPIIADLSGYCRDAFSTFILELIYGTDEGDVRFFDHVEIAPGQRRFQDNVQSSLPLELQSEQSLARWRFQVLSASRQLGFLDLNFELPTAGEEERKALILARDAKGQLLLRRVQYPDLVAKAVNVLGPGVVNGPGGPYPILGANELFEPLQTFGAVRLINPHRVPQSRQPLQSVSSLTSDAQSLGPHLQTLQGNNRETFEQIEAFVTRVFPEFRFLNAASRDDNHVSINLTERATGRKIPLENCGTGVEQIIILATFILTTPKPGTILLDEPHSYLHPTAERALVQFLQDHSEHCYVVSTHSSVLMNSVSPDRITYVSPPGKGYDPIPNKARTANILFDLGYRNSDALFYDRLVFVEGKSDKRIIPILLEKDGEIDGGELARTGFPVIEGVGKGSTAAQTSISRQEKLLSAVGRADQPRLYLFDGDRKDDEKAVVKGTKHPAMLTDLRIEFLPRPEIENYLLVPEAIAAALREELVLKGEAGEVPVDSVKEMLSRLLDDESGSQSSGGRQPTSPAATVKGSRVLEKLYDSFSLRYNKESSGVLIAKHITASTQPAISELTALVRAIFPRRSQ